MLSVVTEAAKPKENNLTPEERELMNALNAQHKANLKNSYKLRDFFEPILAKKYKSHEKALFRYIGRFRDRNIDILSSPYVLKNMIFTENDKNIVFDVLEVTEKEIQAVMDTIEDLPINTSEVFKDKMKGKTVKQSNVTPFRVALFYIYRYYHMKNDFTKADEILFYYACSQYYTIFSSQFRYGVRSERAMIYTIDNMENRYTLKKEGSLAKAITYPLKQASQDTYAHFVVDGADWWAQYIIGQFKTRQMGVIKSVREAYDKNRTEGKIAYTEDVKGDNGEFIEMDTKTGVISTLANKYATKFFVSRINDELLVKLAHTYQIAKSEIRVALENIQNERRIDEVTRFYECLFTAYYDIKKSIDEADLKSYKFIITAEEIYKKGNSKDPNILTIKKISHTWLARSSPLYRASSNVGTLNHLRCTIYMYFVFLVIYS